MAKPPTPDSTPETVRDPHEWKTGDEPITTAQRSYLETLYKEAGEDIPEDLSDLTKAEAALEIEELQRRTGRGPTTPKSPH
jgi:ABC-type Fe3+ transport system substrate-binding protein